MGQLFTRMATVWFDHQTTSFITNSFIPLKPIKAKRKRIEQDSLSNKRKIVINNDADSNRSSRISSPKIAKSSNFLNRSITNCSLSSMTLFRCQLCRRCFATKDYYLDHMIICAIDHQASIKIIRAKQSYLI